MERYDKDSIKQALTIDQVFDLVTYLGGEPMMKSGFFISRTICHNHAHEGSYKLYYYDNTKLFRCFTECEPSTFDIYQLIIKTQHCELPAAVRFVANYFNFPVLTDDFSNIGGNLQDWQVLNKYERNLQAQQQQIVDMRTFDDSILQNLPRPRIIEWENEGIKPEVMQKRGIAYDPKNEGIVIPHYDADGELIGIRERTLIKEEERTGKYKPAKLNGQMYNHPLGFALYNLNNSKDNIKILGKAIVFESEKSCMKYASFFGEDNDISVAVCGSSLHKYQVTTLIQYGAKEIIIAFDREGEQDNKKHYVQKFYDLNNKYGNLVTMSFIYDKTGELLDYKDSPIDKGPDIFMQLYRERIFL